MPSSRPIDGRVTYLNAAAESLTGWNQPGSRWDSRSTSCSESSTRDAKARRESRRARACEGVVVGLANHTILIRRDGPNARSTTVPRRSGRRGQVVGCVLIFRDVTAQRRLESEKPSSSSRRAAWRRSWSRPKTRSSARTLDGKIQAGTRAPSGCSGIPPRKRSAATSRSSSRPSGSRRRPRSSRR